VTEIERLLRDALGAVRVEARLPWHDLAQTMDGMSSAEVAKVARNAAKLVVLEGREIVTRADIEIARKEHLEHPNA